MATVTDPISPSRELKISQIVTIRDRISKPGAQRINIAGCHFPIGKQNLGTKHSELVCNQLSVLSGAENAGFLPVRDGYFAIEWHEGSVDEATVKGLKTTQVWYFLDCAAWLTSTEG